MADDPTAPDAQWKRIQQNVFTRWCNEHLKPVNEFVYNLEQDFGDGIKLIALLEILTLKKIARYNRKPIFHSQKTENIQTALKFIETEGIRLVNIDASDILKGNLKLIMGLVWTLVLKYSFATLDDETVPPNEQLLSWISIRMPEPLIKNFTQDWNDGRAVGALVNACAPGLCPEWKDWTEASKLENTQKAMQLAEDWLGVPQILTTDEMTLPHVDELSMMTYLSNFLEAKVKQGAPIRN